ncbi:Voldacs domain-containing protein [Phanerochaete sordida]|uniref:Voldacs domain-containing protein n=1 Tax=Phanerochaete sordida TaxID=48140 RepID=A0A9P3FZT2_9APHY|nr:Voldacs domain-containing protein [Phanerochaete sordida]
MAPVVVVDSLPTFVSPDVHREMVASTPASFNDIPPVLRHKEENVSVKLDPPLPEFTADDCANGSLYVIENLLIFMSSTGKGLQVEYRSITLHAISRAENVPSIYCQLDESPADAAAANEDAEISDMRELIIIPKAAESLEPIFEALSYCASLHPDPMDENDMDDDDDAFIDADENSPFETFNGTDGEELSEVGRAALAHLESIIYDPFEAKESPVDAEQLDDADEKKSDGAPQTKE